jgi:hypothetical protein
MKTKSKRIVKFSKNSKFDKLIIDLYINKKISTYKIAKKLNKTRRAIVLRLKRHGYKIRDGNSAPEYWKRKYKESAGYIVITLSKEDKKYQPNKKRNTIFEHRLIMSKYLGRPLLKHENVHHKNGDKSDNRLCNLELWSRKQPYGQRVKDKIKYAKEILRLYKKYEKNI